MHQSLLDIAQRVGLKAGDKLRNSKHRVNAAVYNFFHAVAADDSIVVTGPDLADFLNAYGVTSADGEAVTASHVSNCRRMACGLRQVSSYEKPGYKGSNWQNERDKKNQDRPPGPGPAAN